MGRVPTEPGAIACGDGAEDVSAHSGDAPSRGDPRQYWFFRDEVAGTLAMWAIRQSPYLIPDRLTEAVQAMHDSLPDEGMDGMFGMGADQLRESIFAICLTEPTIVAWNQPKSGHTATIIASSRYDKPAPDDDIIDLHALAGNICRTLLADQEDYDPRGCRVTLAPAEEIGQLATQMLALAPEAGLYIGINISPARRDSDGSPEGGDACGSVHDSAGRNGIAEPKAEPIVQTGGEREHGSGGTS